MIVTLMKVWRNFEFTGKIFFAFGGHAI